MVKKTTDKVIKTWARNPAYWTAIYSMGFFNFALILFARLPLLDLEFDVVTPIENSIIVVSSISVILLVMHAIGFYMRLARFAFLGTICAITLVFFGFVFSDTDASLGLRLNVLLFLLSGWMIALSMHIVYGGSD